MGEFGERENELFWGSNEDTAAHLVCLAEEKPPCNGIEDVGCDVGLLRLLWR